MLSVGNQSTDKSEKVSSDRKIVSQSFVCFAEQVNVRDNRGVPRMTGAEPNHQKHGKSPKWGKMYRNEHFARILQPRYVWKS